MRTRAPLILLVALAAGCGGNVRKSQVYVGKNATIEVDGKSLSPNPTGPTRLEIPIRAKNTIRISEPLKAAVVEEVQTLIDPPADAEDRLVFNSTANVTVVLTGEKGGAIARPTDPQALFPDPISRLKDDSGPFFNPPYGQGVLVATNDHRATVAVDGGKRRALERAADATRDHPWSKPLAIELDAGRHTVEVKRAGLKPYVVDILVRTGEYVYQGVRLAEERRTE